MRLLGGTVLQTAHNLKIQANEALKRSGTYDAT